MEPIKFALCPDCAACVRMPHEAECHLRLRIWRRCGGP
jgi:hypothetical protein